MTERDLEHLRDMVDPPDPDPAPSGWGRVDTITAAGLIAAMSALILACWAFA